MTKYIGALLGFLLWSCTGGEHKGNNKDNAVEIALDGSLAGSCPKLFADRSGGMLMSWVREIDGTKREVVYASAQRDGRFGKAVAVPGSGKIKPHGENAPKVVRTPDGLIVAAWGVANPNPKNPYSGLVYYTSSKDSGITWTSPRTLSEDTASIDQRYFDLEILADGTVGAIWLDSRKQTSLEGSSLYFATLGSDAKFTGEKVVATSTCQCCRTDLLVDEKGDLHMSYRQIINGKIRDIVYVLSEDGGKHFSEYARVSPDNWAIDGCPHTGPSMAKTGLGVAFAWYTLGSGKGVYFTTSMDKGKSFEKRSQVGARETATHPQLEKLPSDRLLIVWEEKEAEGTRIGLELRSASGEKISSKALSSELESATYPVAKSVGDHVVIAYTGKKSKDDVERVYYQKLAVNTF